MAARDRRWLRLRELLRDPVPPSGGHPLNAQLPASKRQKTEENRENPKIYPPVYGQLIQDKDTSAVQQRQDFLCAPNQPGPMSGTRGGEEAEKDNGGRGLPAFGERGWSYAVCVSVCKRLTFLLRDSLGALASLGRP